jgi:hypothetical protein
VCILFVKDLSRRVELIAIFINRLILMKIVTIERAFVRLLQPFEISKTFRPQFYMYPELITSRLLMRVNESEGREDSSQNVTAPRHFLQPLRVLDQVLNESIEEIARGWLQLLNATKGFESNPAFCTVFLELF